MSVVMWTYVKESNKAAAVVLQAAAEKELEKALAW
jgi:hypothetical protein